MADDFVALLLELADVSSLVRGERTPSQVSRLNARYHVALRLADLVLRGKSSDQPPGTTQVNGFLFGVARIFEGFVCVALREALSRPAAETFSGPPSARRRGRASRDAALLRLVARWAAGRRRRREVQGAETGRSHRRGSVPDVRLLHGPST
ncbi:5-methylcytosine restriction system specificity protein McrC [Actinopolymorpha pittospori]